ncbi:hypothetical protein B0T24DRAFT_54767 [Lasiosphaeria ovina]|uniref:Uncharacterized protein n=1 Tax=Lasiosphaeria ovina TaxID=92902 RepID=A0AAE0NLC1_9PEZI|nr:hypothetical protein B0T24DRAFT_54767 [Lasiosphaeria ovina]
MGGRGEGHLFERARFQGSRRAGGLEWAVAWLTMAGDDGKGKMPWENAGVPGLLLMRARPHPMRSDACCTVRIPAHRQPGSLALGCVYSFSHSPVAASPRALPDSGRTWERCSHHVCRASDQFEDFIGISCSAGEHPSSRWCASQQLAYTLRTLILLCVLGFLCLFVLTVT